MEKRNKNKIPEIVIEEINIKTDHKRLESYYQKMNELIKKQERNGEN